MGLAIAEDSRGVRFIGHDGGGFGFSADARWYPDERLAVVVLTNSEPDEVTAVVEGLAAAVLPAPRPANPFPGDVSELVGTYKGLGRVGDMVVEVTQARTGDRVLPQWRPAEQWPPDQAVVMGRGLDVPGEGPAPDLSPARGQWSRHGTSIRHGWRPLHPEEAVISTPEVCSHA